MKWILASLLITVAANAFAIEQDTIPNWNFYYRKVLVMDGNSTDSMPAQSTLEIRQKKPADLVATFNYDVVQTFNSSLEIRKGHKVLRRVEYKSNPAGSASVPSVKTGSYFVIPLSQLLPYKEKKDISLDFYYSDDHVSNLKVGTILFLFPQLKSGRMDK